MQTTKQARKPVKRILNVMIKCEIDTDGDTSYLGKYSDRRTSEFSIDREHEEDCASVESNHSAAFDKLERIIQYLMDMRREAGNKLDGTDETNADYNDFDAAVDTCAALQDEAQECDCGGHRISSRELRYFNPSFNYVDTDGHALPGNTPEEVRKYVKQDYERMEDLNRGRWTMLGIYATAEVTLTADTNHTSVVQRICSGGLWGIESDSDDGHIKEVRREELANLRGELLAAGFSRRAIAKAFKDVRDKDE